MSDVCHECGCFECECQDSTPELHKKIYALTAQLDASQALLAERDAEIERLRQQSVGWVQVFDENSALRAENSNLWVRVESGEAAAYEQGKFEARKQAAQEIVDMLRADRWAESELKDIIEKFGLEG